MVLPNDKASVPTLEERESEGRQEIMNALWQLVNKAAHAGAVAGAIRDDTPVRSLQKLMLELEPLAEKLAGYCTDIANTPELQALLLAIENYRDVPRSRPRRQKEKD